MKRLALIVATITLTGCASGLQAVAAFYDSRDPCQSQGRPNYQYPSHCGAGSYSNRVATVNRVNGSQPSVYISGASR